MASLAETYEVLEAIRLFPIASKAPNRNKMMNVQSARQFRFGNAAMSAAVSISLAGFCALLFPVLAIISSPPAPKWVIFPSHISGEPFSATFVAAKLMIDPSLVIGFAAKLLIALLAYHQLIARPVGVIGADNILGAPARLAGLVTKESLVSLGNTDWSVEKNATSGAGNPPHSAFPVSGFFAATMNTIPFAATSIGAKMLFSPRGLTMVSLKFLAALIAFELHDFSPLDALIATQS